MTHIIHPIVGYQLARDLYEEHLDRARERAHRIEATRANDAEYERPRTRLLHRLRRLEAR
jgi:hypothetical protein